MASPTGTKLGSGSSKTSGTSVAITDSATLAVGDYLAVALWCDPASGACSFSLSSVFTAAIGSVVTPEDFSDGSGTSGVRMVWMYAKVTTAGTITQVTVTHPTLTARGAEVWRVQGADGTTPILDHKSHDVAINSWAISAGVDVLLLAAVGLEQASGATLSDGTGATPNAFPSSWTLGSYDTTSVGTTGGSAASNISGGVAPFTKAPTVAETGAIAYNTTGTAVQAQAAVIFQAPVTPHSLVFEERRVRRNTQLRR